MAAEIDNLKMILGGFVSIILGITLLVVVADGTTGNTTLTNKVDETVAITATITTVSNENITIASEVGSTVFIPVQNVTFFGNGTNQTGEEGVNVGDEINFTKGGNIIVSADIFGDGFYNISYTYLSSANGSTADDDVTAVSFFGNATVNTTFASIGVDTEVNFTRAGALAVNSYNFSSGNYRIDYTFEGDLYVVDSASRSLLNLIPIFFSIAIIAIGILLGLQGFGILKTF